VGFVASQIDECLFYRGQSVFVLYTDDSILAGPDSKELDSIIEDMKKAILYLSHPRAQIRTQEVYMKKIISGIRYFFQVFLR
jgi:hypothetical protein